MRYLTVFDVYHPELSCEQTTKYSRVSFPCFPPAKVRTTRCNVDGVAVVPYGSDSDLRWACTSNLYAHTRNSRRKDLKLPTELIWGSCLRCWCMTRDALWTVQGEWRQQSTMEDALRTANMHREGVDKELFIPRPVL